MFVKARVPPLNSARLVSAAVLIVLFAFATPSGWCEQPNLVAQEKALLTKLCALEKQHGADSVQLMETLNSLSELYRGHYDEYSVVRVRMLSIYERSHPHRPGPPPGGPIPRIGLPGYVSTAQSPPTILSKWLNAKALPELYGKIQVDQTALEKRLVGAWKAGATRQPASPEAINAAEQLGVFYCATMQFAKAKPVFESALAAREKLIPKLDEKALPDLDSLALICTFEGDQRSAQKAEERARSIRQKRR